MKLKNLFIDFNTDILHEYLKLQIHICLIRFSRKILILYFSMSETKCILKQCTKDRYSHCIFERKKSETSTIRSFTSKINSTCLAVHISRKFQNGKFPEIKANSKTVIYLLSQKTSLTTSIVKHSTNTYYN